MEIVDLAMKDDKHGDFPVRYLSLHCTSLHFTLAFWNVGTIHSPTQTIRSFFFISAHSEFQGLPGTPGQKNPITGSSKIPGDVTFFLLI